MSLINQEFQKHIKKINNNDFIYKHKIAFYLLSEQQKMSNHIGEIKQTHILPISTERKIIGYQFKKPRKAEIDSVINRVCIMYEVSKKELFTKTRTRDIVRARNIIHNILNEKYKMSLTEIGRIFAQDHTTVLNSIKMKQRREHYWYDNQTIWQEFDELIKS
jgi:chromosomal replication initiation ATPase DnaA